jgi:hypothetical protein
MYDNGVEGDLADGDARSDRAGAVRKIADLRRNSVVDGIDIADGPSYIESVVESVADFAW